MTTQLSTKFTAFAVALLVNVAMIGGVAYLFKAQHPAEAAELSNPLALAPIVVTASAG